MRGFVRSTFGGSLICSLVVLAIATITNASLGGLYVIVLAVMAVWMRLRLGPFEIGLPPSIRRWLSARRRVGWHR